MLAHNRDRNRPLPTRSSPTQSSNLILSDTDSDSATETEVETETEDESPIVSPSGQRSLCNTPDYTLRPRRAQTTPVYKPGHIAHIPLKRCYAKIWTVEDLKNGKLGVNLLGLGASSKRPEKPDAISRITKNILLTNVWNAMDVDLLAQNRVTHVISAMKDEHIPQEILSDAWFKHIGRTQPLEGRPYPIPKRLVIPLDDSPRAPLLSLLDHAVDFMRDAIQLNNDAVILVHCFQGVSRSSSVVLAYLMDVEGMTLEDATDFVRSKRPVAKPNQGFLLQLGTWRVARGDRSRREETGSEEIPHIHEQRNLHSVVNP